MQEMTAEEIQTWLTAREGLLPKAERPKMDAVVTAFVALLKNRALPTVKTFHGEETRDITKYSVQTLVSTSAIHGWLREIVRAYVALPVDMQRKMSALAQGKAAADIIAASPAATNNDASVFLANADLVTKNYEAVKPLLADVEAETWAVKG